MNAIKVFLVKQFFTGIIKDIINKEVDFIKFEIHLELEKNKLEIEKKQAMHKLKYESDQFEKRIMEVE